MSTATAAVAAVLIVYVTSDIQELGQSRLAGQEPDRAPEKAPVGTRRGCHFGIDGIQRLGVGPVGGVVVPAAQPVVVDTDVVLDADVARRIVIAHGVREFFTGH
jgi:hypothetical protein